MLRRFLKRPLKRALALGAAVGLVGLLGLNLLAYSHAWRMTHYAAAGTRTPSPGELGLWAKAWTLLTGVNVPRPVNTRTPDDLGLAFETLRYPSASRPGEAAVELEAWFLPAPEQAPEQAKGRQPRGLVLLFPGYASSKKSLFTEAQQYLAWGFEVLMVDFRGTGGSDGDRTSVGWHESLDVQAAARYARERFDPPLLVLHGSSMGAVAALRAVHAQPELADALVLEGCYDSLLGTTLRRFDQMGIPGFPAAWLLLFWGGVQLDFDPFALRPRDWLEHVHCPTLLVFGSNDPYVRPADAVQLTQHAGTSVVQATLEGGGHPPLANRASAWWQRTVRGFIDRVAATNE